MTNKVVLRSVDEFMADFVPTYAPLFPLLMSKAVAHPEVVGEHNFRRLEAVGDIRVKRITPKDTEMQQVAVGEKKKTFKKYFYANQFIQSNYQDKDQNEDVIKQVLDENFKLADEMLISGDGGTNAGLHTSSDANYVSDTASVTASDLSSLHSAIMTSVRNAEKLSGSKLIIFYGATLLPLVDSIYANGAQPFKDVLGKALPPSFGPIAYMPADVTPSGNGWIIVNMDQIKLHYTTLPKLDDQGINAEKKYSWHNFVMGSMMLEVLALGGVRKTVATIS